MRIALIVVFAVAAAFAAGAFYFVLGYIEDAEEDARLRAEAEKPGVDAVELLVAATNLPAGTVIKYEHFSWQPWPDDSLSDDYIFYREDDDDADDSELEDQVVDLIVRRAIVAGEPLTLAKLFERDGATFLSGMLAPGMRAYTIKVKSQTAVAGFIRPGDRVDVIISIKWKVDNKIKDSGLPFTEYTSETIIQNARVLAVNQSIGDLDTTASKTDAVTIEISPKQVEVLAVARNKGSLTLAYPVNAHTHYM